MTSEPDRDAAERFLTALDPSAQSFTFQTFDDNKDRNDEKLARVWVGSLSANWDRLVRYNDALGAGIFVTVNETDGKGRKEKNIVRVRAVFVDLDGAPLPEKFHVKPHVVVESSPGKWHVYWLVKDCPLDQFTPLQKRLAAHYGGDVKVKDLPRVLRVPGFVHQKDEPFLSRLVEAHDHSAYAIEEVTAGFPKEEKARAQGNGHAGEERHEPGDVDRMLRDMAPGNIHDTQLCVSANMLDAGATINQVTEKLLARTKEVGDPNWDWRKEEANVRKMCKDWLAKQAVTLDDFHAYMPMHQYIYTPTREMWPASSVDTKLPRIGRVKPSAWLDRHKSVEQMTWTPGMPMLISDKVIADGGWVDHRGATVFNLYKPPTIVHGDATKAGPWLDHVRKVYPTDADHVIAWLAHRVQRPQEKVNHGLVLGGAQGIGKDTAIEPVKRAVGPWNVVEVSPQQMLGHFNGFAKAVILRVSEARDLGELNRFAFYEHMKVYLAAPPDVIRCNEKFLREHSVLNCCGVIITSNRKDSFCLVADDRRHFVAWSDLSKEDFPEGYWKEIWGWYDSGGYGHVAAYLAQLDLTDFDPKAPPPKTTAFWEVVNLNRAPEDSELADLLDALGDIDAATKEPIRPDAVTLDMLRKEASRGFAGHFDTWLDDRRNSRQIPHRMAECGYVPVRNDAAKDGFWRINDKRQVVYARADLSVRDRHAAAAALAKGPLKQEEMKL
jgi:RepB DNA-primase N-terminal domain/Family of unknown function (DUF5906)